jgi:hypothetical protein
MADEKNLLPDPGIIVNAISKATMGHSVGEAVSHLLSTMEAQVRAQFKSCGICRGQSNTGAGFLRNL